MILPNIQATSKTGYRVLCLILQSGHVLYPQQEEASDRFKAVRTRKDCEILVSNSGLVASKMYNVRQDKQLVPTIGGVGLIAGWLIREQATRLPAADSK